MNRKNQTLPLRRQNIQAYGRNQNIAPHTPIAKLGPITNTIMIGLMVTVLGLIYLTQATRVTSYDYRASQVDSQIAELAARKNDLEIEKARLTSLETLQASAVAQNMTTPESVNYIRN